MIIIDKTPFQDSQGNMSLIARSKGILKYGRNWIPELEAQNHVIAQLNRILERGYVGIRNFTLPNSEIVIPFLLIGPSGLYMIFMTPLKGHFEAKGEQWNMIRSDGSSAPVPRNLVELTSKLMRAFENYLQNQKITLKVPIEPLLIASDPGTEISSVRPAVRVLRSDAIKQFANSLLQARPVLKTDSVNELADRILEPRTSSDLLLTPVLVIGEPPISRAQAIFKASESAPLINLNDLEFAFDDDEGALQAAPPVSIPPCQHETSPALPLHRPAPAKRAFLGMTRMQWMVLIGMSLIECGVIIGFAVVYYLYR